jgi:HD-GYP domain-containing protein (c-di-GMP phosphodiesterase class II)
VTQTTVERERPPRTRTSRGLRTYLATILVLAGVVGALAWVHDPPREIGPLLLLCAMGVLSFQLREPAVSSKFGFSFISIILLASAVISGVFGAWLVGFVSVAVDRNQRRWSATFFNMSMTSLVGASIAVVYRLAGGKTDPVGLDGALDLALQVGLPLIAADVVGCLVNAVLLAGVFHFDQGAPVWVVVRSVLASSGLAYVGYGVIGFLFVVLWYPVDLRAFSALLIMAPLLAARWAFIQYGEEVRSHERTVDTLVTALGTKEPAAVARSRRAARLAEWVAEELGLGPGQIGTVRYAATLHEIGHLGVPTRLLRRPQESLTPGERRIVERHCVMGARMIEGIDFLADAQSGIRHQSERFDGGGRPDGLAGQAIPVAARIVAVTAAVEGILGDPDQPDQPGHPSVSQVARELLSDPGRFDPDVVTAVLAALEKHVWPQPLTSGAAS